MGRDRSRSRSPYHRNGDRSRTHSPERDVLRDAWRIVRDDPHDFDAWCRLLQIVEQLDQTKPAREAYDEFLKRYPFCYGYWRKYAEFERRHKHYEKCLNVYEAGLQAIPLSVDLWLAYIGYVKEIAEGQRQATVKIRDTYMRALSSCGLDFRSDKLWEEYIDWEIQKKEFEKAAALFDVILATPTMGYAQHFDRYKSFVNSMEPDKVLSTEEYDEITDIVYKKVKHDLEGPMFFVEEFEEEAPSEEYNNVEMHKRVVRQRRHIDLALKEFREEILQRRHKKFMENEREVAMRWAFESQIKRPYFHVKPLERTQLKNWYDYLEFEIGEKKRKRIITLFERCMIACALYDEMWTKYAVYLDSINDLENARDVFKRAIDPHCSRKPGIHLAYSIFEEKHGDIDGARQILSDFQRRHPNYAAIELRKLSLERRELQRTKDTDFSTVVSKYEKLIYDETTNRRVSSFYAMKLARFHLKIRHDRRLAEKIIRDAIARDKKNCQLYLQLVDIAYTSSHMREADVLEALDFALDSPLSAEERFQFSQRKLDFLEELSSDVSKLQEHYVEHLRLEKELEIPATTSLLGKRLSAKDELIDPKRARVDFTVPPPMVPNQISTQILSGGVPIQQGYGYQSVPTVYNANVPPPNLPNLNVPPPSVYYGGGGQPATGDGGSVPVQANVNISLVQ